ncbi:uncharacterized protein F4822DRAFT_396266 [Hypoxylon trugodes]|uniref:uncharacterized protein n=1 Tax=Hypoxylon trugodes TaxID=326681 RepID=UPI00219A556D|nr:uncharacterized protein F4822DRAFT_396266 [Hypoxylon trugodes]KAI1391303.1 hypothetical protein F4822DRAFT_396266 [Hypoxylon trugodes]
MSTMNLDGRRSIVSVRSFAAFERYDEDNKEESNITDILQRRSSLGTSIAETVASPLTFRKIWAETANLTPADRQSKRPLSIQSGHEHAQAESASETAPGDLQPAETRLPSSPNRSVFSRSTKSREKSSYSSLGPRDGNILHALQIQGLAEQDGLEPLAEEEIDPSSFNLVSPGISLGLQDSLEKRSEAMFSADHLKVIFDDTLLLRNFITFLYAFRPKSVSLLVYYLDASKALKAMNYANSVVRTLVPVGGLEYSRKVVPEITNGLLLDMANEAFEVLAGEDLPAYITYVWAQTVRMTIKMRIADTLPENLKERSEGLAEAFCLTDPSRHGNPVIFASKEFYKMTQYAPGYVLGRNCRFIQGPYTNPSSLRRMRDNLEARKEHCETLLNYRRDGSPFMNLVMVAPLLDSHGVVRYHIGAQVDVSGLATECAGLESLKRLLSRRHSESALRDEEAIPLGIKDDFSELAKMFSLHELKTIQGISSVHRQAEGTSVGANSGYENPRDLITDDIEPDFGLPLNTSVSSGGRLSGIYEHYLLVRPYPNLKVIFASPSLRIPGMLQSNFMSRIGGPQATREVVLRTFASGHGFTANIRWMTRTDNYGRNRWIHCTPLLGINRVVGVWMVVIIDDDAGTILSRTRDTPPVNSYVNKERPFDNDTNLPSFIGGRKEQEKPRPSSALEHTSKSDNFRSPTLRSNKST